MAILLKIIVPLLVAALGRILGWSALESTHGIIVVTILLLTAAEIFFRDFLGGGFYEIFMRRTIDKIIFGFSLLMILPANVWLLGISAILNIIQIIWYIARMARKKPEEDDDTKPAKKTFKKRFDEWWEKATAED